MAARSRILAWRIPRTEEPGGLQSLGSQRVRRECSDSRQTPPVTKERPEKPRSAHHRHLEDL